jgi:hypothetical protein
MYKDLENQTSVNVIRDSEIRNYLKKLLHSDAGKDIVTDPSFVLRLLDFVMKRIKGRFRDLDGLKLLLLANGDVVSFGLGYVLHFSCLVKSTLLLAVIFQRFSWGDSGGRKRLTLVGRIT